MESDPEKSQETSERIARFISFLTISPFQIVLYAMFGGVICNTFLEECLLNTVSGIFYLLIPFIPLLYVIRKNHIRDYSIPREKRMWLYLIQCIGFAGGVVVYYFYESWTGLDAEILMIFTLGYLILHLIGLFINYGLKHKISLHMTGAASAITGLVMVFGWLWGLLYLFCIPIGWSRVKLRSHTVAQVITGTVVATITIIVTFLCFGYW